MEIELRLARLVKHALLLRSHWATICTCSGSSVRTLSCRELAEVDCNLLGDLAADVGQAVWESLATDEDFKPFITVPNRAIRLLMTILLLLMSHHEVGLILAACVVEEGYRVSEADVADSLAPEVLLVYKCKTLADIVQVLGTLNDGLYEVFFVKKHVTAALPPEVEEVVLEQFEVSHQEHLLSLEVAQLITHQLSVRFG